MRVYFWAFYSVLLGYVSVIMPVPYCFSFLSSSCFWSCWMTCRTLLPQPGIKPMPPAVEAAAAAAAKSLQSCPTLCGPIDGSPPGSAIPGLLQARTPEWAALSFSNAWKWKVKVKSFNRDRLFATPWTAAHQAPRPWDFPGESTGVGCPCRGSMES